MRKVFIVAFFFFAACATSPRLQEGRWTGSLTPMNHPDMANPVAYDVDYEGDVLQIALVGPSGAAVPTRDIHLSADTLRFTFDEPEENVPLQCALASDGAGGFAGRCADESGKWARFTMRPPRSTSAP